MTASKLFMDENGNVTTLIFFYQPVVCFKNNDSAQTTDFFFKETAEKRAPYNIGTVKDVNNMSKLEAEQNRVTL